MNGNDESFKAQLDSLDIVNLVAKSQFRCVWRLTPPHIHVRDNQKLVFVRYGQIQIQRVVDLNVSLAILKNLSDIILGIYNNKY